MLSDPLWDGSLERKAWCEFIAAFEAAPRGAVYMCRLVEVYAGLTLILPWPARAWMTVRTLADVRVSAVELGRLARKHLCCPDRELTVLGLAVLGDTIDGVEVLLIVGPFGEVYGYNGRVDDALYRLAEDMRGFAKRGLRRYDPAYEMLHPCLTSGQIAWIHTPEDIVTHAEANRDHLLPLSGSGGLCLRFGVPGDVRERWRVIPGGRVVVVIGCFWAPQLPVFLRRYVVVIDAKGRTYASDSSSVVRLAESFRAFVAKGPKRLWKNYRLAAGWETGMTLPVTCIHVPIVQLPARYYVRYPSDVDFAWVGSGGEAYAVQGNRWLG